MVKQNRFYENIFRAFNERFLALDQLMALLFGDKNCSSLNGYKTMSLG
jgi:hypothetical protein